MHGTEDDPCQHCGGIAGEYIEIARNTFLGDNRLNFYLRGTPTFLAEFHQNVLVGGLGNAIKNLGDRSKLIVSGSEQFNNPNPTNRLGVGDFDGDGNEDLFLATGAAWYYAPAANPEWRFLSGQTDKIDSLLFGDFDADGRTDVFTMHGNNWDVSWGGASKWETVNGSVPRLSDFAVGDFVGDRRADVFYADGNTWYISEGAVGGFTPINTSGYRIPDVRFGDFNADGKSDVFSVVSGQWMVSYNGLSGWTRLRTKLTDSVNSLIVGDFNGDRYADVATPSIISPSGWRLKVSYSGTGNWIPLRTYDLSQTSVAAIGRFDDNASEDILLWKDNYLEISAGGVGVPKRQSRQDMR